MATNTSCPLPRFTLTIAIAWVEALPLMSNNPSLRSMAWVSPSGAQIIPSLIQNTIVITNQTETQSRMSLMHWTSTPFTMTKPTTSSSTPATLITVPRLQTVLLPQEQFWSRSRQTRTWHKETRKMESFIAMMLIWMIWTISSTNTMNTMTMLRPTPMQN